MGKLDILKAYPQGKIMDNLKKFIKDKTPKEKITIE